MKSGDIYIGIVEETGVRRILFKNENFIAFNLCAYIYNDQLKEEETTVYMKIPTYDYTIEGLKPLTIVEFIGEKIQHSDSNRIDLYAIINTTVQNTTLQKFLEKRQESIIFKSDFFGDFYWCPEPYWFEIKTRWISNEIRLFLSGNLKEVPDMELSAIKLFERQDYLDLRFKEKISKELLKIINDRLDSNKKLFTMHEFQNRINLKDLIIGKNGFFEARYSNDSTLLPWKHSIGIYGNLNKDLNELQIIG